MHLTHGKTQTQLDQGEIPPPIEIIAAYDGAEFTDTKTMAVSTIRFKSQDILEKHIIEEKGKKGEKKKLIDNPHSIFNCLLMSFYIGKDNAKTNHKANNTNFKWLQKLNEPNEYLEMKINNQLYYLNIKTVFGGDKKGQDCMCCVGGSSANCENMDYLCECSAQHKGLTSFFQCPTCRSKNRVCYCYSIFHSNTQNVYKEKLKSEKYQKWNIKWPKKSSKAEDIHNFLISILLQMLLLSLKTKGMQIIELCTCCN